LGLGALALLGLHATYSGWLFLAAGGTGLIVGLALAYAVVLWRQPVLVLIAATAVAYFGLGALVTATNSGQVLPTPTAIRGLSHDIVFGWKDMLTTLPPVASNGPLLALPFAIGLATAAVGGWLLGRTTFAVLPALVPLAALSVAILIGTPTPSHTAAQAAVFAVAALAWIALRWARLRPPVSNGAGKTSRLLTAIALLAVAGAAGALTGPSWPGASTAAPVLLRGHVSPPFDIGQYPSPLAGFRAYTPTAPRSLAGQPLFRVSGLPTGTLLRLATLDDYTGTVWTACNPTAGKECAPDDRFQRVGHSISEGDEGSALSATVTILRGYTGVWLPDAGQLTGVAFDGPDGSVDGSSFRYDTFTGTGVVPATLVPGDHYSFSAVMAPHPNLTRDEPLSQTGTIPSSESSFLGSEAERWSGGSPDLTARVFSLAEWLKSNGYYTDGGHEFAEYLPGHSVWRLQSFVDGQVIAGDDEQYAAAFALMVNQIGAPARVVLGAVLHGDTVYGRDVHAWVEVKTASDGWRVIPPSAFIPTQVPPKPRPLRQHAVTGRLVPPPNPSQPQQLTSEATRTRPHQATRATSLSHPGFRVPGVIRRIIVLVGIPLACIALILGAIPGWKARRRRRRRSRGTPSGRCAGGWVELIDHARDLGLRVPTRQTRREQAAVLDREEVWALAARADMHVFGPGDPSPDDVQGYWDAVAVARRRLSREASPIRRLRAALSVTTFRSVRAEGRS
jgi:hypothetical protein